jgi:hypothetical protein
MAVDSHTEMSYRAFAVEQAKELTKKTTTEPHFETRFFDTTQKIYEYIVSGKVPGSDKD